MGRIRLHIRYQGSDFAGWQKQPDEKLQTVQGCLEQALLKLTGQNCLTVGSGRTDAGTHARKQVVHFDIDKPADRYPWVKALNAHLPESIQAFEAFEAPDEFHALLSCQSKTYDYYIQNSELKPLFRRDFVWHVRKPLTIDWLNRCASHLVGTHDFSSFQNAGTEVPSTVKTLYLAKWQQIDSQTIRFRASGDGFLKQMVRNLVGTQVDLFRSEAQPTEILKVLQAQNRSQAGLTAPATGLFLTSVKYPSHLDNRCRKL
ncbi:MAG: tRNA pseudouridine(38-40) synthase TruA [Bdellovibrionales bacterium]|nr:tRNA pseudouridine(38-40) synthase TruA [Bdellovibrionales bacterium]